MYSMTIVWEGGREHSHVQRAELRWEFTKQNFIRSCISAFVWVSLSVCCCSCFGCYAMWSAGRQAVSCLCWFTLLDCSLHMSINAFFCVNVSITPGPFRRAVHHWLCFVAMQFGIGPTYRCVCISPKTWYPGDEGWLNRWRRQSNKGDFVPLISRAASIYNWYFHRPEIKIQLQIVHLACERVRFAYSIDWLQLAYHSPAISFSGFHRF